MEQGKENAIVILKENIKSLREDNDFISRKIKHVEYELVKLIKLQEKNKETIAALELAAATLEPPEDHL